MRTKILAVLVVAASVVFAEHQPFERYQSIIDREMFGKTPPNFDPTKPSSEAPKVEQKSLTREQEVLKSSIHFSAINVTPDGATAVGFTDNANPKLPIHYYLKVGEERNGWRVVDADAVKATMRIVKNDVEVSLSLGANSAKGGGTTTAANSASARDLGERGMAAGRRAGLLGQRRGLGATLGAGDPNGPAKLGSLRERRAAREQERQAEAEKEKAQREAEREEQRKELQQLKDELKAQRDAAEQERAAREAERAAAQERSQQADVNANDEN